MEAHLRESREKEEEERAAADRERLERAASAGRETVSE